MTPVVGLIGIALTLVGSCVAHEYAHVLTARALGWRRVGWRFRWYGVGFATAPPPGQGHQVRWIAGAGLAATAALAALGLALGGVLGATLLYMNAALLLLNSVPVPGTDGWHVLIGWRPR